MKCLSFIKKHTGTFMLFCLLFVSFFVSSLFVSNSYALADITITVDDSNYNSFNFNCGNDCSSYHYLLASDFNLSSGTNLYVCPFSSNQFARLTFAINGDLVPHLSFILYSFDSADQMAVCGASWSLNLNNSLKLTLSENNPFGSTPTGSLSITSNGTYDVTNYAEAVVDVPPEVLEGDYHQDLINITNGIYVCAGTILVIYFFYCIYRLIIKNSGVK